MDTTIINLRQIILRADNRQLNATEGCRVF